MTTVRVAVPRKGRPLEAVLSRFADAADAPDRAEAVIETLRQEKAVTKGQHDPHHPVYERLARYSDPTDRLAPEYTLLRDAREGMPRRVVFDSCGFELGPHTVELIGREEPFRALRKHEFAMGFDSADLVLEEVVELRGEPLSSLEEVNDRIDPRDTHVRVVSGLDDTVYHTMLSNEGVLTREALAEYEGPLCISPRYERLVEAVIGGDVLADVEFCYPGDTEEEAAIADVGVGVYLTVTGSTAREHGLSLGERLFPSETVLLANGDETTDATEAVAEALFESPLPA